MFEIDDKQNAILKKWSAEQDAVIVERQRAAYAIQSPGSPFIEDLAKQGLPYYGAIGGALSFTFTPTGVGTVLVVRHAGTGQELDLTDYENW